MGSPLKIFICQNLGETLCEQERVEVNSGRGIVGDRYFSGAGSFSNLPKKNPVKRDGTFVAVEALDEFNQFEGTKIPYTSFRRNLLTRDVNLESLIGKEFYGGELKCYGVEACEPCVYLSNLVHKKILPSLVGKASLRAAVLTSGKMFVGAEVTDDLYCPVLRFELRIVV